MKKEEGLVCIVSVALAIQPGKLSWVKVLETVPRPDDDLVKGWQAALAHQVQIGNLTETMMRTYEWGFAQFLDWLEHQGTGWVNERLIRKWISGLQRQGHNSFSINFWLNCVQSFFAWAYATGALDDDPTRCIADDALGSAGHASGEKAPFILKDVLSGTGPQSFGNSGE